MSQGRDRVARFTSLDWPKVLDVYAKRVNPLLGKLLGKQSLLYPKLISHGMQCFGAKEVMGFLGRKLVGQFQGEIITDVLDLAHWRIPGTRIKHRVGHNFITMYDKVGVVLGVETVINSPEDFRVRKSVRRRGRSTCEWVPMRKGVGFLFRYRDVSMSANSRYLDAFAVVSDPSAKVKELDQIARTHKTQAGRTARGFNPIEKNDVVLFKAVMNGAHHVRGFTNKDLRQSLRGTDHLRAVAANEKRCSARAGRILHRLHQHGLIAKIPRSRKWRTTGLGRRLMATAIQVREINFPQLLALAA